MKRSVVMAGIVVVSMAVLPSAAFADETSAAAVPAQPADCRPAGGDPGGGSGTGDPATGGDKAAAGPGKTGGEPAEDEPATGGDEPGGEKPEGEKPEKAPGGEPSEQKGSGEGAADETPDGDASGGDKSGGDQSGGDQSGGDQSGGDQSGGDQSGGDQSGGDQSGGDKPSGGDSGGQAAGDEPAEKPAGDKPADEPAGEKPAAGGAPAAPDPCAAPKAPGAPAAPADPAAPAGAATSAATIHKWGKPNRVEDFDGDLGDWSLYDGEGHAGNGRRSPEAASTKDGLLTINGDGDGTTAGMAWNPGQKYGRWEGRVKAPVSDPSYNALLLLWPDAENFPVGGEVDFMEMTDHTRQKTELFLHYGEDNSQVQGDVQIDATQWHNWAVEWTPEKITAFVDGKEWWSTTDTSILPPGPMHLCIQLDWFPDNGKSGVKPSEMQVDWVRQYALPEGDQGGGQGGDQGGEKKGQEDKGQDKGQDDKGGTGSEGLVEGVGGAVDHLTRRTEGAPDPVGSAQRGPSSS